MNYSGTYSVIPTELLHDENISGNAKVTYLEVYALCNDKGYCYASNLYLANVLNTSIGAIKRHLKELKENGYIKITGKVQKRTISVLFRLGIKNEPTLGIKNELQNNINNNINKYIYKYNNNIYNKTKYNNELDYKELNDLTEEEIEKLMSDENN